MENLNLQRRVVNYLFSRQVPSLRRMAVEADDGIVTIRGMVGSYYEKQLCLSCCQRVAGVVKLVDEVEVAYATAGVN